jgi:hypothetical protein
LARRLAADTADDFFSGKKSVNPLNCIIPAGFKACQKASSLGCQVKRQPAAAHSPDPELFSRPLPYPDRRLVKLFQTAQPV